MWPLEQFQIFFEVIKLSRHPCGILCMYNAYHETISQNSHNMDGRSFRFDNIYLFKNISTFTLAASHVAGGTRQC